MNKENYNGIQIYDDGKSFDTRIDTIVNSHSLGLTLNDISMQKRDVFEMVVELDDKYGSIYLLPDEENFRIPMDYCHNTISVIANELKISENDFIELACRFATESFEKIQDIEMSKEANIQEHTEYRNNLSINGKKVELTFDDIGSGPNHSQKLFVKVNGKEFELPATSKNDLSLNPLFYEERAAIASALNISLNNLDDITSKFINDAQKELYSHSTVSINGIDVDLLQTSPYKEDISNEMIVSIAGKEWPVTVNTNDEMKYESNDKGFSEIAVLLDISKNEAVDMAVEFVEDVIEKSQEMSRDSMELSSKETNEKVYDDLDTSMIL